jgi:adenylate kinase
MIKLPNILVTGTPGTGKTTLASSLAEKLQLKHIIVGDFVKEYECHEGYDEEFQTYTLDEDKLCDLLEPILNEGGVIIDFHSCEIFPERWFELVLVLRSETSQLYDRLVARNYSKRKIDENMECEIMQVVLESARESYALEIIQELNRLD